MPTYDKFGNVCFHVAESATAHVGPFDSIADACAAEHGFDNGTEKPRDDDTTNLIHPDDYEA